MLRESRIHHIDDTIDCNRSLGNICGNNDLTAFNPLFIRFRRSLKYTLLLVWGQCGVERDYRNGSHLISKLFNLFEDLGAGHLDFLFSSQEDQNVSFWLVVMDCHGSSDGSLDVVCFWLLAKIDVDGVSAAWNVQAWSLVEVLLELGCIKGGGHDNQLQIRSLHKDLLD